MSDSELSPEVAGELQRISRQLADEVLVEAAAGVAAPPAAGIEDAGTADGGLAADENWEMRPLDPAAAVDLTMDGFTELRCHGVSGPLPASVLGFPEEMVTEVDGNAYSGFWRRWMLGPETDVPQRSRREAFCWGGLTSRASTQALWLLLLPFSLVNLAHWMVLPYPRERDKVVARSAVVLLRVLALSLTGTLLLAGAEVTMDLGAWQCGQAAGCRPKLLPFGLMNKEGNWPGLRLGAAAVLLGLVLLLLWRAGLQRYAPLQQASRAVEPTVKLGRTEGPVLGDSKFWAVDKSTRWLRGLHALFWCAGTGAILAGVLTSAVPAASTTGRIGYVLLAVNLLVVAVVVALMLLPDTFGRGGKGLTSTKMLRWLMPAGLALLAVSIGVTVGLLPGSADPGGARLPRLQGAYGVLVLGQLLVLILLAGCTGWLALRFRRERPTAPAGYKPMLGGALSFVLAFLGWFLALCYSAGIGLLAAGRWGSAVTFPTSSKTLEMLVPPSYQWIEVAGVTAAVALVAGVLVVGGLRLLLRTPGITAEIEAEQHPPFEYGDLEPAKAGAMRARARSAARIAVLAQSVEMVPWLFAFTGVAVVGVVVAAVWEYFATGAGLHPWFPLSGGLVRTSSIGTWLATASTAALVALVYSAYRNQSTRRIVGILWDVTTFWPRANHPLTPACTAERSVPQLTERMMQLTDAEFDRVVLSAHSQGAVLGLAAVLRLDPDRARQVALLTFGCPLRRLYARCFPAYFSPEALNVAAERLGGRWINLWARTDPIGGTIEPIWHPLETGSDGLIESADEFVRPDPLTLGVDRRTGEQVSVCGHSGYVQRPAYDAAVHSLRESLTQ